MDSGVETKLVSCGKEISSEDYFSFFIIYHGNLEAGKARYNPECIIIVSDTLAIFLIKTENLVVTAREVNYNSLPKPYTLLDTSSMEESGVLRLRRQPYIKLTGKDVLVGLVDTGIDYTHPVFKNTDNTTRIGAIWDQSIEGGTPPEEMGFGAEYTKEQMDLALQSEDPLKIVPTTDELGHGTFMAGIMAGNEDKKNDFTGAAPMAEIVAVKLRKAKKLLTNINLIKEDAVCFSETDIILGIKYLYDMAKRLGKAMVICLGIGTNSGGHTGSNVLAQYIQQIGAIQGNVIVCAGGNEGNAKHHYQSEIIAKGGDTEVEISVGENERGFTLELWATAPQIFSVGVTSPGGEVIGKIPARINQSKTIRFLLEKTVLYIDYKIVEEGSGDELIAFRFEAPTPGIWRIRVYNESEFAGKFDMWLPVTGFNKNIYFVKSNPYITICEPANGKGCITCATYNHNNGSLYIDSSRGYNRYNQIVPDITAPGVNVYGPVPGGRFSTRSGSSIAAAHTAGCAALLLEWGIVNGNDTTMNTQIIKKYLIRGAKRGDISYPNQEWGYGILDIYETFQQLRTTV